MKKLNVAIVGLSFGLEFVPIYLEHPDVESLTLVETNVNLFKNAMAFPMRTVSPTFSKYWIIPILTLYI